MISVKVFVVLFLFFLFVVVVWVIFEMFGLDILFLFDEVIRIGDFGLFIFLLWVILFEVVFFVLLVVFVGGIVFVRKDEMLELEDC